MGKKSEMGRANKGGTSQQRSPTKRWNTPSGFFEVHLGGGGRVGSKGDGKNF